MSTPDSAGPRAAAGDPALTRAMGLLQATATNVISMVGVGPFLTIPFMVAAMVWSTRSSAPRCRAAAVATCTCARRSSPSASAA
jgi:hypothetical protein